MRYKNVTQIAVNSEDWGIFEYFEQLNQLVTKARGLFCQMFALWGILGLFYLAVIPDVPQTVSKPVFSLIKSAIYSRKFLSRPTPLPKGRGWGWVAPTTHTPPFSVGVEGARNRKYIIIVNSNNIRQGGKVLV